MDENNRVFIVTFPQGGVKKNVSVFRKISYILLTFQLYESIMGIGVFSAKSISLEINFQILIDMHAEVCKEV